MHRGWASDGGVGNIVFFKINLDRFPAIGAVIAERESGHVETYDFESLGLWFADDSHHLLLFVG
jgi:hypothetical protein